MHDDKCILLHIIWSPSYTLMVAFNSLHLLNDFSHCEKSFIRCKEAISYPISGQLLFVNVLAREKALDGIVGIQWSLWEFSCIFLFSCMSLCICCFLACLHVLFSYMSSCIFLFSCMSSCICCFLACLHVFVVFLRESSSSSQRQCTRRRTIVSISDIGRVYYRCVREPIITTCECRF